MTLSEYLDGMRAATTPQELEAAIQADFKHRYYGRTWNRICNVRKEVGRRICEAHPLGRYVPSFGAGRLLMVCGETYKVGRGHNTTGVRYVWHGAREWACEVLLANGFTRRGAHRMAWGGWNDYPHRCLSLARDVLDGKLRDPVLDRLIFVQRSQFGPVKVDRDYESKHRAHRPCGCGGTRWDWGCGNGDGFDYINWYCDGCPRIYVEYLSPGRLYKIRNRNR